MLCIPAYTAVHVNIRAVLICDISLCVNSELHNK